MMFGITVGTIFPLVFGILVNLIFFRHVTLDHILSSSLLQSSFIQFGVIGNLLLFFIYMVSNKKEEQKGIVLPTLIYALVAIILKLL